MKKISIRTLGRKEPVGIHLVDLMNINDKLSRYAAWCGQPLKALGYRQARLIPVRGVKMGAIHEDEAEHLGKALLSLQKLNRMAFDVVIEYYLHHRDLSDIAMKLRIHSVRKVADLLHAGRAHLIRWLRNHT